MAAKHLICKNILEIGCSSGYGSQFLPPNVNYVGIDKDKTIIQEAKENFGSPDRLFFCKNAAEIDISTLGVTTLIAFETFEHIHNGVELFHKFQKYVKCIIASVPYNEGPEVENPHHLVRNLLPEHFPKSQILFLDREGNFHNKPSDGTDTMVIYWKSRKLEDVQERLSHWLRIGNEAIFDEVVKGNGYQFVTEEIEGKAVLDIGANRGMAAVLCAELGATFVIAVEPAKDTFDKLVENTCSYDNINCWNVAIGDKTGEKLKIFKHPNDGHNSAYKVSEDYDEIDTYSLDDFVEPFPLDGAVLKLDCEGAEYDIILNAKDETLKKFDLICLEIHADLHPKYKGCEILEDRFHALGFNKIMDQQVYVWYPDGTSNVLPFKVQKWSKNK